MYTTPLSTLITSLSFDHHLYADDTQLFFSFHPLNLTQAFLTLKTLFNRSLPGWLLMFSLLTPLSLNSCSSDSNINLPKYTTLHLTPHTLLKILASSLTNILLSLTKLHLSPKTVTITFVNFAIFGLTSMHQLPVPLLLLSSTPNWITVILSTINSLSLNYPISSRSRTLLLVLSLKLLSPVISLPFLRSLHWLRITERIEYKLLSLTYKILTIPNLHTFITSSPFNFLAELALHPSLLCLGQFIILSKNNWSLLSLCFTSSLESAAFVSSSTSFWYQFLHFRLTCSFTHHFFLIHNSLSLSLLAYSLPVSQILPPPVVSLIPPGLPSRTIACPFLLSNSVIVCNFTPYFFVSVPCARLSCLSRQLLSAR